MSTRYCGATWNFGSSQINGCNYCIWLHSKQARDLGEPEERIDGIGNWREADCYSAAERAALAWTEAVTEITRGTPPDELFDDVKAHFSELEIVDLTEDGRQHECAQPDGDQFLSGTAGRGGGGLAPD